MPGDGVEHGGHSEGREHVDFGVEKDGEVHCVDDAGDVEEGEHGDDFVVVWGREGDHLEALSDDVLVADHDGFGEACCSGGVAEKGADVLVLLAWWDAEERRLVLFAVAFADAKEVLHSGVAVDSTFKQKDVFFGNANVASSLKGDGDGGWVCGDEFGLGDAQGVGHFLDIVSRRRS